ncbi:Leucine-rich repeat protein kinase family protein [Raphanus sativus]|nr:Leucine-rich repeat protein kinase family protein [Raphanus sativus]
MVSATKDRKRSDTWANISTRVQPKKFGTRGRQAFHFLLDSSLTLYISNFGLTRLITISAAEARLPGSKPMQKWDVYSFVVWLMELLTKSQDYVAAKLMSMVVSEVPDLVDPMLSGL